MIEGYFQKVEALVAGTHVVHSSSLTYDKRSTYVGYIRGEVIFLDGSVLHLREFVNVQHGTDRYMYAYQYQDPQGRLLFRYDNSPHYRMLTTFPHHKHAADGACVIPADEPGLGRVLAEIRELISTPPQQ